MKQIKIWCLILIFLNSCERKCKINPIPANVFDVSKIKPKSVLLKCNNEIDSLTFNDKWDSYTETSFKGPMNIRRCGHSKSYKYNFRNETLQVILDKNENSIFELQVIGWCTIFNDIRIIKENELLLNKEYIFERETDCDSSKSDIKTIIIKGYLIKSIVTIDNKIWIPE